MRLTGGDMKGRQIRARGLGKVTKHGALRATSSKVRAALFNILQTRINGAVFCDLYAGSGTVGMEAMSRGAGRVYFVEADKKRFKALKDMLDGCGCHARMSVVEGEAMKFIHDLREQGVLLDIVFLDPPYEHDEYDDIIALIGEGHVLADGAVVVVEHGKRRALPDAAGALTKIKSYGYGDTVLTLYVKEDGREK